MKLLGKNTRYYLDMDLTYKKVINLNFYNQHAVEQQIALLLYALFTINEHYNKLLKSWH